MTFQSCLSDHEESYDWVYGMSSQKIANLDPKVKPFPNFRDTVREYCLYR
jgi:hypothetical protein